MAGFFITFEGGEGSGKTTQINKLAEFLSSEKHKVVTTREPGGTNEAEKIRDLLVQKSGGDWLPMAELLLINAARAMHVEKVIRPALDEGKIVICDRFTDSTLAYQGYGRGLDLKAVASANTMATGGLQPDLTLILDIDPEKGLARSDRRFNDQGLKTFEREDRFENLGLEFHSKLRDGFLEIATENEERCVVIDAVLDVEALKQKIRDIVLKKLSDR